MIHVLTERQFFDLEMIMNSGFYPLEGFLKGDDYISVVNYMRLKNGKLWPIPITLDIKEEFKNKLSIGEHIVLTDKFKNKLAYLQVESIYKCDKINESLKVFGSTDVKHPSVNYLFNKTEDWYIGGKVIKISDPIHTSFISLRKSPQELKEAFKTRKNVIGFQTRNPIHKSHYAMTKMALDKVPNSHLLLHPVIGTTKDGDIDVHTRVKCYREILEEYNVNEVTLALLPLSMRMAGPREALWHAIIRKNYGCTHFIVGRDHAGPGNDSNGKSFYGPYEAQELCNKYSEEIGINILTFSEIGYVKELDKYVEIDIDIGKNEMVKDNTILNISGTQFREKLLKNEPIPEWFAFPNIVKLLRKKPGLTILLTGLSGSGKSTLAYHLMDKLLEETDKNITILDGDEIRENLSKGLTFSKEDRDINVKRIAYVASLISKNEGICIVPCIAPYAETRKYFRETCEKYGNFIEIYVSTSLEVCENRDVKGLYKLARNGEIKQFTGIDDPYEIPENPDIIIDTDKIQILESVNRIMAHIFSHVQ